MTTKITPPSKPANQKAKNDLVPETCDPENKDCCAENEQAAGEPDLDEETLDSSAPYNKTYGLEHKQGNHKT